MATELWFPGVKEGWLSGLGKGGYKVSAELDGIDICYQGSDAKQLERAFTGRPCGQCCVGGGHGSSRQLLHVCSHRNWDRWLMTTTAPFETTGWVPNPPRWARLLEIGNAYQVDPGYGVMFARSTSLTALGAVCFAYGLDNELFGPTDGPASITRRWMIWYFCWRITNAPIDEQESRLHGLALAQALAPTPELADDLRHRFHARVRAIC